ncbi:TIGR03960 family B12-binding radical SAM protein [Dermatophilus congolensis]|uniref:TIGR03960 family B12-binding radical SAM protein n=1 Tax=Dermatophilus congolensis TaxID=1863 RepID=UPI001AAEBC6B|nr:TIGR03960 family B12-binding radical SAM protein [Dermatophilus congolensis]MBO3142314.1 TIGR03960 family B12-binding radical SAM protein [Dermatophilus congolensis]MBO3151305.1 TIGR03960 family B12-binding radical SAM protein [Dermatophilus congolensis]MBO3161691.1 TIGR03960 family B12-binding radical SAM protein [Dermatophilus congolensis]MBO3162591.1 TIGR03960 family B12-binding radical SAM protein [Dermatophilus congolensis]MBO3176144.1 TIGR03960 family B12-binding radical SAM protein [
MRGTSRIDQLEPLLGAVNKPIQYLGGEMNSQVKDWDCGGFATGPDGEQQELTARWALMYPDAYEVGLPNQGLMILYEVLNERSDALAERTYAVWPDLAESMRASGVPLLTVDAHRAVCEFDVLGISFSTELNYTNMLEALDLAGIPLHAHERGVDDPIVLVGGHASFNPEPIARFIDAAIIGDGEAAVLKASEIITAWKKEGRPGGRTELLTRLAVDGGVYVPGFYEVTYRADGCIEQVCLKDEALAAGVPERAVKHTVTDLDEWPYPKQPIVPIAETVHERMSVEIFRGCTRGCRFCQAGMITRPVRERSITGIGEMVESGLAATGYEEVGLLSLSSADHSEIAEITKGLADRYEGTNTSLSLPSTRVDAFNIDLANELSRNGRRSGLTFAPEGGSERLRRVINKMVSEDDLIQTVSAAYGAGWRQVKLYFMCGLPTETDEDVLQIAKMASRVIEEGRKVSGSKDIRCTVSIGGFVPKAHTPFQWAGQLSPEETDARLVKLRDAIRADKKYGRSIGYRYHDGKPGQIEGLLSRGDRRVGEVIEAVWRDGGKFDGWSEHFSHTRWVTKAAEVFDVMNDEHGWPIDLAWFTTRERTEEEVLPWDHIDSGLDKEWLWDDWQDALEEVEQDDCRWTPCFDCGVCPTMGTDIEIGPTGATLLPLTVLRDGAEKLTEKVG